MYFEYEVLMKIKERPGMYLEEVSLVALDSFLNGYTKREIEISGKFLHQSLFPGFQKHVSERFDVSGTQSWVRIINFYSSTQQDGVRMFYELLDEYLKQGDCSAGTIGDGT